MRKKSDLRSAQQRTVTALYEGVWYDPLDGFSGAQCVLPMGGGKTATALTAFKEMQEDGAADRLYVLAPKRVANLVWPAEPKLWEHLAGLKVVLVAGSAAQRLAALNTKADVYAIGVDNTQWFVTDWLQKKAPNWFKRTVLAIDELSRFKNPRGKRAKALFPHIGRFLAVWGLTGTPRPNGYEDQFMPLKLVTRGKLWGRSFDRWREQNFYPTDYNQYNWALIAEREAGIIADINKATITIPLSEMPDLPPLNAPSHAADFEVNVTNASCIVRMDSAKAMQRSRQMRPPAGSASSQPARFTPFPPPGEPGANGMISSRPAVGGARRR